MKLSAFLLSFALVSTQVSAETIGVWNNDGGSAGHSGYADVKTDPAKFKVVWNQKFIQSQALDGLYFTNPAITDHMIYVLVKGYSHMFDPGITGIYALNSATGEIVWKNLFADEDFFTNDPVFDNGKLYWVTEHEDNFQLTAVDAETGAPQLSSTIDYKAGLTELSDPVMFDHHLYIGDQKGFQYSLSADTGKADWAVQAGDETNEPTIAGDYVVRANYPGLDIINRQTGEKSFMHVTDLEKYVDSSPVWDEKSKTLYAMTWAQDVAELSAIDLSQRIVKWKLTMKGVMWQPVVDGDVIYSTDFNNLYEINAVTGKVTWTMRLDSGFHDVIVTPDLIFVSQTEEGQTRAISRKNHRVVWASKVVGRLSIDANRLYILGAVDFYGTNVTAISLN